MVGIMRRMIDLSARKKYTNEMERIKRRPNKNPKTRNAKSKTGINSLYLANSNAR